MRIRYGQFRGLRFDYLFASHKEVRAIVEKTGWTAAAIVESQGSGFVAILEKTWPSRLCAVRLPVLNALWTVSSKRPC